MKCMVERFGPREFGWATSARVALVAVGLIGGIGRAPAAGLQDALTAYDAAIAADSPAPSAKLGAAVTLDGTAGSPFNFGATSGDTTMEFLLTGDPTLRADGYLAVGENATSNLRYAQWDSTRRLGFTQLGVADYLFDPSVPSPVNPSHVTYVWNAAELTMTLYLDGELAGTAVNVSDAFAMPTGAGFLGNNAAGTEGMTGTIYRVTVYPGVLPEAKIKSHAATFIDTRGPVASIASFAATPGTIQAQGTATLNWQVANATTVFLNGAVVTGTSQTVSPAVTATYTLVASNEFSKATATTKVWVDPRLDVYDAAIAADTAGGLKPLASSTTTLVFDGTAGAPFDFGATSGDTTMEFVFEGDPVATGDSGFLAVGENTTSSLRYEQWQDTRQMGFTQGGVADYMFVPGVPSPLIATHVAYVWNAASLTMSIYVNGVASGTIPNVSDQFAMPTGAGFLGSNPTGGEPLIGRIFRVIVYGSVVPEATIKKHANAFTSVLRPPIIASFTATPTEILGAGTSLLKWQVQDATGVFLNGVPVTGTEQTVTPVSTTAYTLLASNAVSKVTAKVTVLVTPQLGKYDAAITADAGSGTAPLARLTDIATLTGSGLVPFDFGATSGDTTMEFILEGDPTIGADGYLAVGENATSNLRYAQWSNTRQLGFTQLGVADYMFTPAAASPTVPTHVTFVWDSAALTMKLYVNGLLASSATGVSDSFGMPSGAGFLGSTATGGEAMVGRIFRIAVYSGILPDATIRKHAEAFASGTLHGASLSVAITAGKAAITLQGDVGTHYRVEYRNSLSAADAWQVLAEIPSASSSTVSVPDPAPIAGRSQRFYRSVTLP